MLYHKILLAIGFLLTLVTGIAAIVFCAIGLYTPSVTLALVCALITLYLHTLSANITFHDHFAAITQAPVALLKAAGPDNEDDTDGEGWKNN